MTAAVATYDDPHQLRRIRAAPDGGAPVGPFSQAVVAGGFVFTSGQIPAAGANDSMSFGEQVRRTLDALDAILRSAGSSAEHVVKVNTYLTDVGQLEEYNEIYAEFFADHLPARTSVCVQLWGVALEIECVAVVATGAARTS